MHALDRHIARALAQERQLSGRLGALALTLAFAAVAIWCALVHPWPGALFYLALVAAFVGLAWTWGRLARRALPAWFVLVFVLANAGLLTVTLLVPNPLAPPAFPIQMKLRPPAMPFFLLLIAWSSFALSPWLVLGSAVIVVATWTLGAGIVAFLPDSLRGFGLPEAARPEDALARYLDPRFVDLGAWASGVLTCCLVAGILAVVVGRMRRLVDSQARLQRARENLGRHVSANLVEALAEVDEPFGPVRQQEVAVLFVDLVGFTGLCETMTPEAVIVLLRGFHERMADCVFEHGGTLDKFVGDSVMATFGTPQPGTHDAASALACARAMLERLARWNEERRPLGAPPLRVGIGLHFGPVVLGDIGSTQRLEWAVLGDTVNTASRLEGLTRQLGTPLIASRTFLDRARSEAGREAIAGLRLHGPARLRGRAELVELWVLAGSPWRGEGFRAPPDVPAVESAVASG